MYKMSVGLTGIKHYVILILILLGVFSALLLCFQPLVSKPCFSIYDSIYCNTSCQHKN